MRRDINIKNPNIVKGNKYGSLTIISESDVRISEKGHKQRIVTCECNCGSINNYIWNDVRSGKSVRCKECSRLSKIVHRECNLCGNTFEQRNMTESKRFDGYVCKNCFKSHTKKSCKECDTIVDTSNGNHSQLCKEHWNIYRIAYLLVTSSKSRAKQSGIPHDIDLEWVKERLIICEVTGIPFEMRDTQIVEKKNYSNRHPMTPTIDKIDPCKGYTKDNCRIVCWWFNLTKSIYTDEQVHTFINTWIENKGKDGKLCKA